MIFSNYFLNFTHFIFSHFASFVIQLLSFHHFIQFLHNSNIISTFISFTVATFYFPPLVLSPQRSLTSFYILGTFLLIALAPTTFTIPFAILTKILLHRILSHTHIYSPSLSQSSMLILATLHSGAHIMQVLVPRSRLF